MSHRHISEERLQAFVDDQLEADEKSEVFEVLQQDKLLNQHACELRKLNELVKHAYQRPPAYTRNHRHSSRTDSPWWRTLAAGLLLATGTLFGWLLHQPDNNGESTDPEMHAMYWDEEHAFHNSDLTKVTEQQVSKRIIVHLNTSNEDKFGKALDTAEQLLKVYAASPQGAEIEVVANASAVRMLRSGYSPYTERVRQLQEKYFNLTFLACKDALDHARELEGLDRDVPLLPEVEVTPSALEHILNRLSEGWVYLNV
jgi:intracellular sulfur oxidation DsrE/DsrF family protein